MYLLRDSCRTSWIDDDFIAYVNEKNDWIEKFSLELSWNGGWTYPHSLELPINIAVLIVYYCCNDWSFCYLNGFYVEIPLILFLPNIALAIQIESNEIGVRVNVIDSFYEFTTNAYHNIFTMCIIDPYLEVAYLILR